MVPTGLTEDHCAWPCMREMVRPGLETIMQPSCSSETDSNSSLEKYEKCVQETPCPRSCRLCFCTSNLPSCELLQIRLVFSQRKFQRPIRSHGSGSDFACQFPQVYRLQLELREVCFQPLGHGDPWWTTQKWGMIIDDCLHARWFKIWWLGDVIWYFLCRSIMIYWFWKMFYKIRHC